MTPSTTRPPPLTIEDFRLEASTKLKKIARDYYEAGSDDQLTLNRNESAFKSFPIGIAPTAFHRMATKDGELSTVEGASATGTLMIASSWSTTSIEEIAMEAKEKNVELWFQKEVMPFIESIHTGLFVNNHGYEE
uniref:FMN-dependent dehydrogenase domain containing protein n=1 Tax=Haemonchus contortus TaxID=6289 RepID=W6NF72_HAECO